MRRVFSWLFNRTVLAIVGLVIVAVLIWYVGPSVHIGTSTPLESSVVRIVLIALIVAIWLSIRVWHWWRDRSANAALLNQLAKEDRPAVSVEGSLGAEEVAELRKRFETALATLKKSRVTGGGTGLAALFSRRYVYQMPWYVFIGAPGSGKTTALVNSGLEFPLADKLGKAAVRGVGGTRNCDWWFTNEAVLLDTAGRYTTQESNQAVDKVEWEGFLGLLRKYRPRAPINGVFLTVSVADILGSDDDERARHATAIRRRLAELYDLLKVRFPIYVVVTKTDLLAGFNEYFDRFTTADRAQVWGFTFPLEDDAHTPSNIVQSFRKEYALLQKRIEDALPDHLQAEPNVARRALAYAFTQEFAGLRDLLEQFLTTLASESKFAHPPLFRGVYFTSGTQEGTPIDRVLGSIQRRFGIEARVQSATAAKAVGKSFFLKGLLQDLVFGESHLVARNPAGDRRRRIVQAVGVVSLAILLSGVSIAWVISYSNNRAYLAEIEPKARALAQEVQATANVPRGDFAALLPVLNEAKSLASSERFDIDSPPLSYRFGMYQGKKVSAAAGTAYNHLLDGLLLPRVALRLEKLLSEAQPDDLEATYGRLKAYLMMHEADQYRPAYLTAAVSADLQSTYGSRLKKDDLGDLTEHLRRLLGGQQIRQSPFTRNDALIKQARDRLAQDTQAKRVYRQLKGAVAERLARPEFSLVGVAGPDAKLVFTRKSRAPLDQGIEPLFTREGYRALQEHLNDRRLLLQFDETWVLGRPERSAANKAVDFVDERLLTDVRIEYLKEYRQTWESFLADVRLRPANSPREWSELLQNLSAPDSPFPKFVRAVADETKLAETGKQAAGIADRATEAVKQAGATAIQRAFGSAPSLRDAAAADQLRSGQIEVRYVDQYFEPWQRLAAPPGPGGTDPLVGLLKQAYDQAQATESAIRRGNLPPPNDTSPRLQSEAGRLPIPLREMFESIAVSISAQTDSGTRDRIGAELNAAVGDFCRTAIAGRYPIARGAAKDISLDDFATMFGPGGKMEDFFQKRLLSLVDTTTKPWSYKKTIDGAQSGTSVSLRSFQYAEKIRDAFFRSGSRTPQFRIEIKLAQADPSTTGITLDVDGQTISMNVSGQQAPRSVTWPGTRGSSQVSLRFEPPGSGGSELVFNGPWALHRMFDRARITPGPSAERFNAELGASGRNARFEIYAGSVLNPLKLPELEGFNCPNQL